MSPDQPSGTDPELTIARLEARVAALEDILARRSRELLLIQRHLSPRDLVTVSRLLAGLSPLPHTAFNPLYWQETTELTAAEVEPTLEDLWRSLAPPSLDDTAAGAKRPG